MAAKRRALWQVAAAQLLLVTVPLYGSLPELSAIASTRSHWAPKPHLRASSSAREEQRQASQRFHPEIASGDSFHAEGIGTIRALTDEQGNVTDRYTLEAFGTLLDHQGDDPNAYLFASEPLDPNSGFYYNRERWLDSAVGRFAGMDTYGGAPSEPASIHKYLYVGAHPGDSTDPAGQFEFNLNALAVKTAIIGFVSGAIVSAIDASLRGAAPDEILEDALIGGVLGAVFGPLIKLKFAGTALMLSGNIFAFAGVVDAIEQDNYALATYRGALGLVSGMAFIRSAPPVQRPPAGRLGNSSTRELNRRVADRLVEKGWEIVGGGGRLPEEYLPGPGGARRGANWVDVTALKNGRILRINTVDTLSNGATPTAREATAAALIRSKKPHDHLLLIPKSSAGEL